MNAITLKWEGIDLHANRDAWFNATEIAEAHGKRLDKFWEREETREYLDALCEILNTPKTGDLEKPFSLKDYSTFIKTRRGKYGGTWLHPDLMVCRLEAANAALIAHGKPYDERKAHLKGMAAPIRLRYYTEALQ